MMPKMKKFGFYNKMRTIGLCNVVAWVWVTYDKKIKTAQDLFGKKILIGRPGGSRTPVEEEILRDLGIYDKAKIVHGGYGGGRNALKDGLVDATVMLIDYIIPAGFRKGSFIEDMETRAPIYYLNIMPKEVQAKLNYPVPLKVYPGALGRKTQPKELWSSVLTLFFAADERQDEKVVYEVTRILYENAGKYNAWHAQGASLTKESIPTYALGPDWVHKGAKKYYEEKGIKLTPLADILP
ncbi:MAG: TAXI family TRAP transporter solute-binding subunit, partial [Desulfatiglandales bacterium]|nr:TAXI family TRAP transporter solute-binding subunit [Desulfatiglandales bacterium]